MEPRSAAKLYSFVFVTQQQLFWVYHMNSYANNPIMLRSSKPMIMRDLFLTRCSAPFANPLSTLYVPHAWDMLWNCSAAWLLGMAVTPVVGVPNMVACFFLGGFVSGMSYLFQGQLNPRRLRTEYDCNASSNGGWCAVSAMTMMITKEQMRAARARLPFAFSRLPVQAVAGVYIAQALASEYFPPLRDWYPNTLGSSWTQTGREVEKRVRETRDKHARLTNWGCIGGVFFGIVYGTLVLRLKADRNSISRLFESINIHAKKAGAA